MTIQWYPGHMAKAFRQVEEKLKLVDMVFELIDARLPYSSRNPKVDELVKNKARLVLLTKSDLADSEANQSWLSYFQTRGIHVLPVDAQSGAGISKIPGICERIMKELFEKRAKKGIVSKKLRALVIGIPNVGKSSLINRLAKRQATAIGNRPGITKAQQWIRVGQTLELLDTPGVLWPKFDNEKVAMSLAMSGAIKDEILPIEEVAHYFIEFMVDRYPHLFQDRFGLNHDDLSSLTAVEMMEEIGRKRGCLQRGGEINMEKTSELILRDFRLGRLGQITLELPEDIDEEESSS